MRRYNICVKKTYKKDGQEKSTWPQVGTLVHFEANGQNKEGYKIELPMFGETVFYVFEQTERGSRAPQAQTHDRGKDVACRLGESVGGTQRGSAGRPGATDPYPGAQILL